MGASHSEDERIPVDGDNIPGAGESLSLWLLVAVFVEAFFASSDHGQHLLRGDVDLPNGVVLGVAEIEEVHVFAVNVAHTLRVVELCLVVGPVDEADLSVADLVHELHSVFIDKDDAIIGSV